MPTLTPALRAEYETLFNSCIIRANRQASVEKILTRIRAGRPTYDAAAAASGVPWFFIAAVHSLESNLNFKTHLHNGDALKERTKNVPKGRPKGGTPPFTWDFSAADALAYQGLSAASDWSLAGVLFNLEDYNGWGTRKKGINTPYLWSFSTHYTKGKFVADHEWSPTAVSAQCGAAVILRRLSETGEIEFGDQPAPVPGAQPVVVHYSMSLSKKPAIVQQVIALQVWLNTHPGIFVKVDGIPGDRTSEAYRKVTGQRLPGDPNGP